MSVSKRSNTLHRLGKLSRFSSLGNVRQRRTRVGLLVVALGITATVVASPPPALPSGGTSASKTASTAAKHRWFQIGKASWYGGRFQGKKTANGERFDMNALTCAHRELPLGSWVRVTNLGNKRTVFLRVNDRGPMAENLIVDLSYAAAQKLGIAGLGKVKVEQVSPNDPEMAQELLASLPLNGLPPLIVAKGIGR